jgi:hypothetical protein
MSVVAKAEVRFFATCFFFKRFFCHNYYSTLNPSP